MTDAAMPQTEQIMRGFVSAAHIINAYPGGAYRSYLVFNRDNRHALLVEMIEMAAQLPRHNRQQPHAELHGQDAIQHITMATRRTHGIEDDFIGGAISHLCYP